jgi:SAM-dependent methyltransferase
MPEQRLSFDAVAELYDRVRPSYPPASIEAAVELSALPPGGRILEIGCGTGQATRAFARRGYRMLCLEPGPSLARVARERLAEFPDVALLPCSFEDWPLAPAAFDLVICAQAFHWLDPEVRFAKAAAALRAGGALAVFGNAVVVERTPLRDALDAAYARHAPGISGLSGTGWYAKTGPLPGAFAASGHFGPVASRAFPWAQTYTAAAYVDLLRTSSDHLMLEEPRRRALLEAVGRAVEAHGGSIRVRYDAHLHLARVRRGGRAV